MAREYDSSNRGREEQGDFDPRTRDHLYDGGSPERMHPSFPRPQNPDGSRYG